ncbi:hypothetical protein Clacol_001164 [Clathrus columnatus]|uniref:Peptidase S53 domain-containing protein n=1 Tax=Clathrus columnatus TaxID=1419009 RepID=A0AAV5A096_9AGAM|nr:hypothetical protein Clacol_001164 [Clathrus columnatus]
MFTFSFRGLIRLSLLSSLGLGLLLLFSLIYSSPLHEQLVVHLQLDNVPSGFIQIGKPDPNDIIRLTIGLESPNMTQLEKRLNEISNLNHTDYGKYLSKTEVEAFARPSSNVTKTLDAWLTGHNIKPKTTNPAGNRLTLEMPVNQAEKVFNTSFDVYTHTLSNQTVTRATQYSVPTTLAESILFVYPISHFPPASPKTSTSSRRRSVVPSSKLDTTNIVRRNLCNLSSVNVSSDIAIPCLLELYHVPTDMGVPSTDDEVVVLSSPGGGVNGRNIAKFLKQYLPDVELSKVRLEIVSADGGDSPENPTELSFQQDVLVETVLGIAPNSRVTVVTSPPDDPFFVHFLDFLLQSETMSTVVYITSNVDESGVDINMINAVCNDIMQLTARGTTVVTASGDGGVGGEANPGTCTAFHANFPAICPHTLSVGATQISSDFTEVAEASSAGGGFSNTQPMPSYQTEVVENYLKQIGDLYSGLYNRQGRGFPDVSIFGGWMDVVTDGPSVTGGSADSAGLMAGIIAALNDHRRAKGQGPLGYVHPLIYANTGAFTDITQGSNPGCGTNGFPASGGWDAVTGLGTPLFDELLKII